MRCHLPRGQRKWFANPTWGDIALRLVLTVAAGALIGINRSERGRPAGLRTTILVCLAASVAMIQTNLLMSSVGKTSDSFVTIDVMRLPLGILSGIGFIGAGTILRRNDMIIGITTAATLWVVTVIGLCLGGGQIVLGVTACALALLVLSGLKWAESRLPHNRRARLVLTMLANETIQNEVLLRLREEGFQVRSWSVVCSRSSQQCTISSEVEWVSRTADAERKRETIPDELNQLSQRQDVVEFEWSEVFVN